MELNIQDWKEFYIGDIFQTNIAKSIDYGNTEKGNNVFVGRTSNNNGVQGYVSESPVEKGNCIIIGMVGENWAFYQSEPFVASQNIFVLRSENLNAINAMFLCSVLNKCVEIYRETYSLSLSKDKMNKRILKLPVQHNSDGSIFIDDSFEYSKSGYVPDWKFMEDYIKSLRYKPITTEVKAIDIKNLDVASWEEFKVSDLFNKIYKAKAYTKDEVVETDKGIYFVSRTDCNNGIDTIVDKNVKYEGLEEGNCITIGDTTATCFYQNEKFIAGDHMVVLRANWLNLKRGLFLRTLFAQEAMRYCYGRAYRMDLIKETLLKLPVKKDVSGKPVIDENHVYSPKGYIPDWQFMEEYINSLPYSDRI